MADNERVQWDINDLPYGQLAPSQANRTEFYPGKATSQPGDILGLEYRVPVGTPVFDEDVSGPEEVTRVRVSKLGRNIVSDTEIRTPEVLGSNVTVVNDPTAGIAGTHTVTETRTVSPASAERFVEGHDRAI